MFYMNKKIEVIFSNYRFAYCSLKWVNAIHYERCWLQCKRINDRSDLYMSDMRLSWWDSRDNLRRYRYARSEQGDVTSNPVRIHGGGSRKDRPSVRNPWNLVAATGTNSFIWTTPAKPGDYFRVIAQCIIIWGQPSDGHRSLPLVPRRT